MLGRALWLLKPAPIRFFGSRNVRKIPIYDAQGIPKRRFLAVAMLAAVDILCDLFLM